MTDVTVDLRCPGGLPVDVFGVLGEALGKAFPGATISGEDGSFRLHVPGADRLTYADTLDRDLDDGDDLASQVRTAIQTLRTAIADEDATGEQHGIVYGVAETVADDLDEAVSAS